MTAIPGSTNKVVYYDGYDMQFGKHYHYFVSAYTNGVESGYSNEVEIWMPPPDPTNLTATLIGGANRRVHLTWNASAFANGNFNIYRNSGPSDSWTLIGSPSSDQRVFDDTSPLQLRTQYSYTMVGCNQQCWSFNWSNIPTLYFDVRITSPDHIWENNGSGPKFRFLNQFLVSQVVTPLSGSITPAPPFTYQWEYQGTGTVNNATSPGAATITLGGIPGTGTVKLRALTSNADTGFSDQKQIEIFASHLDRDIANIGELNKPSYDSDGTTRSVPMSDPYSCGGACLHAFNGTLPLSTTAEVPFPLANKYVIYHRTGLRPNDPVEDPFDPTTDLRRIKKGDVVKFTGGINHVATLCSDTSETMWEYNGATTTINGRRYWGYSKISDEINLKDENGNYKITDVFIYENPNIAH